MSINKLNNNSWDSEVDVVVVGFGGAGVCAAIEAADNGASVMVVERFCGGGATRMSGGVTYSGGGTWCQKEAGVEDTPENMFNYLKLETKGVVSDETLMKFCEESTPNLSWLEKQGVPFDSAKCPYKTSYPIDKYFLYFSGNESFPPYNEKAYPAPRGHRAKGKGMPGGVFYEPLRKSALNKGVDVRYYSRAKRLIIDDEGDVAGLEFSTIPKGLFSLMHKFTDYISYKLRYLTIAVPHLEKIYQLISAALELRARTYRVKARKGVMLATGGFIFNRKMVAEYAPKYLPGATLGTIGDDGSAIKMGLRIGAAVGEMERISAWRFFNPPESFVKGVLVDRKGQRIGNEQFYGAQTAELMVEKHNGVGFLIIDSEIWKRAHRDLMPDKAQWMYQGVPNFINLYLNNKKANTIEELAVKCDIIPDKLCETIESYNELSRTQDKDPMNKSSDFIKTLSPPFYAIDCSLGNKLFACATISLGGLVVNEETGEVKNESASIIKGLYAAGRSAVGVTSRGYVSGLSVADAVFSGRRAGQHAATKNGK
jgi:3-oxo-5alpha-steroid 4-dehydrogenase